METGWEDTGPAWPSPAVCLGSVSSPGDLPVPQLPRSPALIPHLHLPATELPVLRALCPLCPSSRRRLQLRHSHCFVIFLASVRKQISGFQTFGLPPTARNTFHIGTQYIYIYAYICVSKQGVLQNKSLNVTHCFYSSVFYIIESSQVGADQGFSQIFHSHWH